MPEFEVVFTHTLTLTGSLTIEAKNEEKAEAKADKIAEKLGGIMEWTMDARGEADEIDWQEDENSTRVESVTEA